MSLQNHSAILAPTPALETSEDYIDILQYHHLDFAQKGYYLRVGCSSLDSGWIFHLSVIAAQVPSVILAILPLLLSEQIPFKIPFSKDIAKTILNGQFGYTQLGKIVSIYPKDDTQAIRVARQIIELSKPYKGPEVLTDRHLGSVLYVRYGAHNPVTRQDIDGVQRNFFYDQTGQLIKDIYTIPFILPVGILWPFGEFAHSVTPAPDTILRDRYKPMKLLKEDARGNVTKSLRLGKFGLPTWCVLKEGKRYMFTDDLGRDIRDRLKWQYQVHQDLYGSVPVPKAYELFEENGDTYLAVEFVKGKPLDQIIISLFKELHWTQLSPKNQQQLVAHAIRLVILVQKLHHTGYVHRDINHSNILIDKHNNPFIIDLELCFSLRDQQPTPPFKYGTAWFMSPEQQAVLTPTVNEDIYALGCTLITTLTGLLPNKFATADISIVRQQLYFFLPDTRLADIIAQCLDAEASNRPTTATLYQALIEYQDRLAGMPRQQNVLEKSVFPDLTLLTTTINRAIQALGSPLMCNENHLWTSKVIQDPSIAYYQSESTSVYPGFCIGVGGIYYVLSQAYQAGFDTEPCQLTMEKNLSYLKRSLARTPAMPGGLYNGTAGIAVAIAEGINARQYPGEERPAAILRSCFEDRPNDGLNISQGAAGKGLALLKTAPFLDPCFVKSHLDQVVDHLLRHQQADGSFSLSAPPEKAIPPGFAEGTAGIVLFLLLYAGRYNDDHVKECADRSLRWVLKIAIKRKKALTWQGPTRYAPVTFGLQAGSAGIALALLKGYDILNTPLYRETAENALRSIPPYPVSRDLTLGTGVTGIGETYLEAYRSLHVEEWHQRAGWIAGSCLHQFQQQEDGSRYWLPDHTPYSTADLLTGTSGVVYFLIRYAQPDRFCHPLLPDE